MSVDMTMKIFPVCRKDVVIDQSEMSSGLLITKVQTVLFLMCPCYCAESRQKTFLRVGEEGTLRAPKTQESIYYALRFY